MLKMVGWGFAGLLVLGAGACAVMGDFANDDPGFAEARGTFEGRFVAVSDADMAGTAYADGVLELFPGAEDQLTLFANGAPVSAIAASNSVISWPQVVDVSDDGRFAFVIETRGAAPAGLEAYENVFEDFPTGTRLSIYRIEGTQLTLIDQQDGLGTNLQSVEYVDDGQMLVIGTEDEGGELVAVRLEDDGTILDTITLGLDLAYKPDDAERRIRTLHMSPDGTTLAVNVANKRVQFFRVFRDINGVPEEAVPFGTGPVEVGARIAVGKWTPDGKFFIMTDTNWGDGTLYMLTQGPGALTVIKPPANDDSPAEIVSRAEVGLSPEGFGISEDGTRVATINMERTYLPELAPLSFWAGRRQYSVSLLSLDSETGALNEIDRIYASGILPEDVIFDRGGNNLAVAVFHRRKGEDRKRGFIDFFSIESDTLVAQGKTQGVMRGAHDLVLVD
jgi:DNA-binding beta-propeller fold protein YncE